MIYLSTGGFSEKTFSEVSKELDHNIIKGLELSSGKYTSNLVSELRQVKENYRIVFHNYFPVPDSPFVFNLASLNSEILKRSLHHAKYAIKLSSRFGSPYYSFHAGYLIDPQVDELGNQIGKRKLNDKHTALERFIDSVNELANFGKEHGVKLMIENNVLSLNNLQAFNQSPLLMVDERDTEEIFNRVSENVGLLVDLAHLKVSANSLKFSKTSYLSRFNSIIKGYHLSDNDGTEDSNNPIDESAWFWELMRKDLDYYSIEVYLSNIVKLHQQYELLSNMLECQK